MESIDETPLTDLIAKSDDKDNLINLCRDFERQLKAAQREIPDGYQCARDTLPEQIKLMTAGLSLFVEELKKERDIKERIKWLIND